MAKRIYYMPCGVWDSIRTRLIRKLHGIPMHRDFKTWEIQGTWTPELGPHYIVLLDKNWEGPAKSDD